MKHIVKTEEEWHALRIKCVTASEAAALVGADPYTSIKSLREPSTFTGNAFTRVGQMLENVVVNVTNDVLGTHFEQYELPDGTKEFYTCDGLGATPDAHQERKILLECKTTRPQTFIKYGAVPPNKYVIQNIVQQICVDDLKEDYGYLSIMSTNLTQASATLSWPISVFKVWKDTRICDILKEEAQRFSENKTFKVDATVKKLVKLLLPMCYEQVKI